MRHDIEVYVNNMVIKLTMAKENCKETPTQVELGKFLEFMLIKRGIEANLKKCQAIINMRSLRNVKEVQQLAEGSRLCCISYLGQLKPPYLFFTA
ncbi:hypothetical protein CR513_52407, partial [Mucuna pruriens]